MKYWLLTSEYPPFYGGGISTYCKLTAQMLANNGHIISIFINDSSVTTRVITQEGNNIRLIRFNPSYTNTDAFLGHTTHISYEFANIVKHFVEAEGAPHIIEAQEYLGIAYFLLQYKVLQYDWCKDIPVIITIHSPSFLYMEYNHVPLYRYPNYWICEMELFCLQAADVLIAPSKFILSEIQKRFILRNANISVISNPFEPLTDSSQSDSIKKPDQIVFFGKLTIQKGVVKLLQYFSKLWDEGFQRPLYMIGNQDIIYHPEGKSMGDIIKKQFRKYISKGLLLLEDKIPPVHIKQRLQHAEVVIVPSANDNLPYVVLEMMSEGKVVLASQQGGQAEIITNEINGFLFDHEKPETFASQLLYILKLDDTKKMNIADNAMQAVAVKYALQTIYSQKMAVLHNLIRTPTSRYQFPYVRCKNAIKSIQFAENKALLSIVIPFYNMGEYIEETIQSVKQTNYPLKEIIIVNDGSTDANSLRILQQYRQISGIKVLDTHKHGVGAARNTGALSANGDFLTFLDADDKISADYYTKAIKVLKAYSNVHFVGCWTQYFDKSNNTWPTFCPEPPIILCHNMINSSALVYRKESYLSSGRNDVGMAFQGLEDYESVISMVASGHNGVSLPETLFFYRVRSNSMIRAVNPIKKQLLYYYISIKHKEFYATFATDIFNLLTANGPGYQIDNPTLDMHLADRLPFKGKAVLKIISLIKKNQQVKNIAYRVYRLINK